jgi:transcriptional regulator with XRE-family HTH domain
MKAVSESDNVPMDAPLHQLIRDAMNNRRMSNNSLAKAAGVSEGTIRNMLKEQTDPDAAGPQAHVLKRVANILELDELRVFQAAGFISKDRVISSISIRAEYLAMRFDKLPPDQQELLMGMLNSLEKVSGIPSPSEEIQDVLAEIRKLQKQFPMFKERRFVLTDRLGRLLGSAVGKLTNDTVETITEGAVLERLQILFRNEVAQPISAEILHAVMGHPNVTVALNVLLPHKNIPSNVEKFYWLIHPENKPLEALDEDTLHAIEALWTLLVRISRSSQHGDAE